MQPVTPSKSSDGIEAYKRSLSARWGLYFPLRHDSPSKRNINDVEEKIHLLIQFLFWRKGHDEGALDYALAQFERHGHGLLSNWTFKPRAESDVLPERQHQDSNLKADFLSKRESLTHGQMQELMACLYEKLNQVAERVKTGQSYIQPLPTEVMSSIEASEDTDYGGIATIKQKRNAISSKKISQQKKITQFYRSKSAPDPSISDEFLDDETEDLFNDIKMMDASTIPLSKSVLDPPYATESARNSPETEKFETPPTTPLLYACRGQDDAIFKKPSFSFLRKRPCPDESRPSGSRKFSKDSSSNIPSFKSDRQPDAFSSLSLRSPSTSFGTDTSTSNSTSFNTASSSAFTSPNTSFSTEFSAGSRSTSFTYLSEESDKTIPGPVNSQKFKDFTHTENISKAKNTNAHTTEAATPENLITDRLNRYPPFGLVLPERYARLPLRQLYEIMRVSLSSRIDFEEFSRALDSKYTDYNDLWTSMAEIVKMHDSAMPERSSLTAWEGQNQQIQNVSLSGKLRFTEEGPKGPILRFTLNPLKLESSYRLSRKYGTDRFCEVSFEGLKNDLPSSLRSNPIAARKILLNWLVNTGHHFLGRTWRAFYVRQDRQRRSKLSLQAQQSQYRLYLFAEEGPAFRKTPFIGESDPLQPGQHFVSVEDMLEWFMPAAYNENETALKLFARLQLAVSKTIPTITFGCNEIYRSDNAYADNPQTQRLDCGRSDKKKGQSHTNPTHQPVMNDGCARISKAAARAIAERLQLDHVPCVFQGRIGGAKGMWMVDALDESPRPTSRNFWIEVTDSQLKFEGHPIDSLFPDPARVTFEVNDFPRKPSSSALNFQLIPIIENRGVPAEVFIDLLKADLTGKISELQAAVESGPSLRLWNQRNDPVAHERAKVGGIEFQGGLPSSQAERINWFVEHGFEPKTCRYLKDQLLKAIRAYCDRLEDKVDVEVGQSTYVFMLADPLGVLEEGQVHICFSGSFHDRKSGFDEAMLHDRDCLVARLPAHLPSDIQKVRAVFKPELRMYRDVIVFPSKGAISLAEMLSGGDYDGDKAWVCWEPSIVDPFTNATLSVRPSIESFGITKDPTKTKDLLSDRRLSSAFIQHGFNFNLQFSMLGSCTHYYEAYCYKTKCIDSPEAIELAHLLGLLVDSAKGGFIFDEARWTSYLNSKRMPHNLRKPAYRDKGRGKPTDHLIDRLVFGVAKKVKQDALKLFNKHFEGVGSWDSDLTRICNEETNNAKSDDELSATLEALGCALVDIFNFWKINARVEQDENEYTKPAKYGNNFAFSALVERCRGDFLAITPVKEGQTVHSDRIREWQRQHNSGQPSYWDLLKASVAFSKYHFSNFIWHVAGIELGEIKVKSGGRNSYRSTVNGIFNAMRIDGKAVDGIKRREDLEEIDELNVESEFGGWDWIDEVSPVGT